MITLETKCFHCGEICQGNDITLGDKSFCCHGCLSVYSILHTNDLAGYYCLNEAPGNRIKEVYEGKFKFLDDESVSAKIISFKNNTLTQVHFYLPQIHCSSCLWLLENVTKLNPGIISSQVHFGNKTLHISFDHHQLSLRQVAELLTSIGYEPFITLQDIHQKEEKVDHKNTYIRIGVAGFCFFNIMLISFPEYLGLTYLNNQTLTIYFRYINLLLSLPVILYAAQEFFKNSWTSLRQHFLSIDVPITLALVITFLRSVYDILSNNGPGYLDSMSGIVFFMLIGRALQQRTFTNLKFNRDFKSYFPISVTVIENGIESVKKIQDVIENDIIKIHHAEIIPVDCILSSKSAEIDYSFITGESESARINAGEIIYAGGKLQNTGIEVIALKPFSQNGFTALWNNRVFKEEESGANYWVTTVSKYFSFVLLIIALVSFVYWELENPANAWNALTSVLIVACPCTLLLASSYSSGFIIEFFSKEGMFVKNAETIDKFNAITHIVFDKTGTLSEIQKQAIELVTETCDVDDISLIQSILRHSSHPLSKVISSHYSYLPEIEILHFKEIPGQGIEAWINEKYIKIGHANFVGLNEINNAKGSAVYFTIDREKEGCFVVLNSLKPGIEKLMKELKNYKLSLLSGDADTSYEQMKNLFPLNATLSFRQSPQQKLEYIKALQARGEKVLMVGDGINDAGALKQSDLGISVVDDNFSFSPASDAICHSEKIAGLYQFFKSVRDTKKLILATFIYSLLYNVVGLSIAVSAHLKPVVAAILMPSSSISVILIAYAGTKWIYKNNFKHS